MNGQEYTKRQAKQQVRKLYKNIKKQEAELLSFQLPPKMKEKMQDYIHSINNLVYHSHDVGDVYEIYFDEDEINEINAEWNELVDFHNSKINNTIFDELDEDIAFLNSLLDDV